MSKMKLRNYWNAGSKTVLI